MADPMEGKSPLQVVGWLGSTGYQTVIHDDTRAKQAEKPAKPIEQKPANRECAAAKS